MNPQQYQRLQELFLELREVDAAELQVRLDALANSESDSLSSSDANLLEPLRELLKNDTQQFLEQPVARLPELDSQPAPESGSQQNSADATDTFQGPGVRDSMPDRIAHYQILQRIGEGGHGIVYMAEQKNPIRRKVALKLIKPGMESKEILARFEAERQALALMKHPSIANVLDAGTEKSSPYFVMELVHGLPIDQFCQRNKLTLQETLQLVQQVCEAVHHAHRKGIIHRDLKPANILVTLDSGKPLAKVIDFGIAKALHLSLTDKTMFTEYGQIVGTLEYMSPEQATMSQDLPDVRSDVYSLGVVLYVLLTGSPPISKQELLQDGLFELNKAFERCQPATPSLRFTDSNAAKDWREFSEVDRQQWENRLRGDVDWITMKALATDPKLRYDSAAALSEDIQNYLDERPVLARPPSWSYQVTKWIRRHRVATLLGTALLACLWISLGAITWAYFRTQESLGDVRAANEIVIEKAKALEQALSETDLQRRRADESSMRLASRLKTEILGSAWLHALDGSGEMATRELQEIAPTDRDYVWQFVDGVRQQSNWPELRSKAKGPIRILNHHSKSEALAVITTESVLEIWDLPSQSQYTEFQLEPRLFQAVEFSSDGKSLLLGASSWCGLVDVASGELLHEQQHNHGGTRGMTHDASTGTWLVTTGSNHVLVLSDEDLTIESERKFDERLLDVWTAPGGKRAAVSTITGSLHLVSTKDLKELATRKVSNVDLVDLTWESDESEIQLCDRFGRVYVWDLAADNVRETKIGVKVEPSETATGAIACLDGAGNLFQASQEGAVTLQRAKGLKVPLRRYSKAVVELVYCPESAGVLVRHFDGSLSLIDHRQIQKQSAYAIQLSDLTDGLTLETKGQTITGHSDGSLKRWQMKTGKQLQEIQPHQGSILSIDTHQNSGRLVSYGEDWRIRVASLESLAPHWEADVALGVRVIRFNHAGNLIAGPARQANEDWVQEGTIDLWHAEKGELQQRLVGHRNWVLQLQFSQDDKTLYSLALDGSVRAWQVDSGKELFTIDLSGESPASAFVMLEESETLILGHQDGSISSRRVAEPKEIRRNYCFSSPCLNLISPGNSGVAMAFSEHSADLSFIDLQALKVLAELDLGVGAIQGMRADRNSRRLQVLGSGGAARIWDLPAQIKSR